MGHLVECVSRWNRYCDLHRSSDNVAVVLVEGCDGLGV
jgi:hypothetical protein